MNASPVAFLKILPVLASLLFAVLPAGAQPAAAPEGRTIFGRLSPESRAAYEGAAIRLWAERAPGAKGDEPTDTPVLYPVMPARGGPPTGAVIVLAGGSYRFHSAGEAFPIAEQFRDQGLAAFVLRYRLAPDYVPMVDALADAQRAVRLLRARAAEFNLDPERIAVIGFSAGGHLAANLSVSGDDGDPVAFDLIERQSCRVRTVILFYPVILARETPNPRPTRSLAPLFEAEGLHRRVDDRTPPTFMIVGYDDTNVPYDNCLVHTARLHEAGVRFELHILGSGGHGAAVREARRPEWTKLVEHWLTDVGVVVPAK